MTSPITHGRKMEYATARTVERLRYSTLFLNVACCGNALIARTMLAGLKQRKTVTTTDLAAISLTPGIYIILEVTGDPAVGVRHGLFYCEHKKYIVMAACLAINLNS
ncbi:hypothetical protein CC78DRAFT_549207 [Lojkania enalia]|uniref:Uncharacterized protein n=1 Tax=Lojkania enalia TaxID=147567 RepID=A0A9P4JWP3_9PLEO|nr:hypothetical protein CC78DRAFT_549207 [Didymosphaeria enalia]